MKATILLLVPALLSPSPAPAQKTDAQENLEAARSLGPPEVSLDELELLHYAPRHLRLKDLYHLLREHLGRHIFVKERGGRNAAPVENLSLLGARILLHDTPEHVARMVKFLEQVDIPVEGREGKVELEYRPSYLSLSEVSEALDPFERRVELPSGSRRNLSWRQDVLVVHETPDVLEEIQTLLKRIDVPREQVLITSFLLGARPKGAAQGGHESALPEALAKNLEAMLPGQTFHMLSYAVLRSAVGSGRELSMRLERGGAAPDYEVSMRMVAWARETGDLTVEPLILQVWGHERSYEIFSTSTTLKGGEYTVLGATGSEPIFLVLRFEPARR